MKKLILNTVITTLLSTPIIPCAYAGPSNTMVKLFDVFCKHMGCLHIVNSSADEEYEQPAIPKKKFRETIDSLTQEVTKIIFSTQFEALHEDTYAEPILRTGALSD